VGLRSTIYGHTTGSAAVAAIISDRCYPDRLPDGVVLPCVSFVARVSDNDREYRTHDTGPVERTVTRVQLNVYAETGDGAEALTNALVAAWSGWRALPEIGSVQVDNVIVSWEPQLERHRTIIDLMVERIR